MKMSEKIRQIGFSISLSILILLICLLIYNIYLSLIYKIDVKEIARTEIMTDIALESKEGNIVISVIDDFFDNIKKEKYDIAYNLLDNSTKSTMFNDSLQVFQGKMEKINKHDLQNDYIELSYSEDEKYTDTEIWVRMYMKDEKEKLYGDIRLLTRVYNDSEKKDKIFILSFRGFEEE